MDRNISILKMSPLWNRRNLVLEKTSLQENICISSLVSIEGTVKKKISLYGLVKFEVSGIVIRLYEKIIGTYNSFPL